MWYSVEVRLDIRIDYPLAAEVEPLIDFPQCLVCILPGPEAVREVLEVRLEQGFDNDLQRCLNYTIGDDRDGSFILSLLQ